MGERTARTNTSLEPILGFAQGRLDEWDTHGTTIWESVEDAEMPERAGRSSARDCQFLESARVDVVESLFLPVVGNFFIPTRAASDLGLFFIWVHRPLR